MKRYRILIAALLLSVVIAITAWSKEIAYQLKDNKGHFAPQKTRKESSLSIAIKNNDTAKIEALINDGWDVNSLDEKGRSALQYAVVSTDIDKVRLLLEHGADINYIGSFMSPLCVATSINKINLVKLLVENGADIQGVEQTLLPTSVARGNIEAIELFIAHGADVDVVCAGGKTPIFDAIYDLNVETMKTLIKHNADVNHQDENSETPLHHAIALRFDEGVELLLEHGADLEVKTKPEGSTPLHMAAILGREKIVDILLRSGANPNALNNYNLTPLNILTYVRSGFMHNSQAAMDTGELTAEEIAGRINLYGEIIELLIQHGAQVSLHDAVLLEDMDRVKDLLVNGADINAQDTDRMTPLCLAIATNQLEMCKYLLRKGADVNIKAQNGMTALDVAVDQGHTKLSELLKNHKIE